MARSSRSGRSGSAAAKARAKAPNRSTIAYRAARGDSGGRAPRADGWVNPVTALGTSRDARTYGYFSPDIISEQMARFLWRTEDICKRVVEARPFTAFRRGIRLKLKTKEQSEQVGAGLEDLDLVNKFVRALCFENAYGGSAIFPVVQDVGSLEEPLDDNSTYPSVLAYHVLEPRELSPVSFYDDINDPKFRQPKLWRVMPMAGPTYSTAPDQYIHESRLIIFPGRSVSNGADIGQRPGFGDGNLSTVFQLVRDYGNAWGNVGAILKDFAAGTLAMEGYAELMKTKGGAAIIRERMRYFSEWLSSIRMGVMDKKDTYNRSTTPLGGLSDILHDYAVRVAAAAEQPVTVLFGEAPAGLNATGDNDIRGWYDTVAAWREYHVIRRFERAVEIFMGGQDSPTNGNVPDVWSAEFPPLWEPSEKEQAETRKTIAETDQIYYTMTAVDAGTIAESRWRGDTYSSEMHIDWDERDAQAKASDDMAQAAKDQELAGGAPAIDPSTGLPIAPAPGAAPSPNAAVMDVQKQALNGAQVASLLEIIKAVVNGEISRESGAESIALAFQLDLAEATKLLGPAEFKPTKPEPKPNPFVGGGPPIPPKPPIADGGAGADGADGKPADDTADEPKPKAA